MIGHTFDVQSRANLDAVDVTDRIAETVPASGEGLALVATSHTTVGLLIGPGDDAMRRDFIQLAKRWPSAYGPFEHFEEDNPNSEAHLLSAYAGTNLMLRYGNGRLALGKYQRLLFLEFDGPRDRKFSVHYLGSTS